MEKEKDRDVEAPAEPTYEVAPENVGRTAYGELRGNKTGMYGTPLKRVEQFPDNITPLELKNWYNYDLNGELPNPISSSVDENRRVWQDMEVERMLDHHPTHEVHPSDLPDYHYWPMIQNEVNHKSKSETLTTFEHRHDATDIPRFFRTGIPKTPLQEQDWHVPLDNDGRFNWRENIARNGYAASLFSKSGWDRRFLLSLNRPNFPGFWGGGRQMAQAPILFRTLEFPIHQRVGRQIYASTFDRHFMVVGLYLGLLAMASANSSNWKELNWDFEIGNWDMTFMLINRDKGGYHGII